MALNLLVDSMGYFEENRQLTMRRDHVGTLLFTLYKVLEWIVGENKRGKTPLYTQERLFHRNQYQ